MDTPMDAGAIERRQGELGERVDEALARVIEPIVARLAPGERLSAADMREIYKGLAPLGYLGSTIPISEGGAGMSYVEYGLLLEALARAPVVLGEIVPPRTVFFLGDQAQKERWLPRLLAGDLVSTAAITEPQAGSDLRSMTTTALASGDQFVLKGRKKWIKLGGVADLMTVLAITDPETGYKSMSRLIVERDASPWTATELPSVGIRNLSYAEVAFDSVKVPKDNLLGDAGSGVAGFSRGIEASRAIVGLQAAGIARAALDLAVAYTKTRVAFGRPIAKFQAVQITLAEAAARVEASRSLAIKALQILDAGRRCPREASMAKFFATETSVSACATAMGCMGAHGLSEEAGVERHWRNAMMLTAMDGTSDIQRLIVGREELGMPAFV